MTDITVSRLSRRALLLASVFAAAAPVAEAQTPTPRRGGTMVMLVHPEPSTLATYAVSAGNIPPVTTQIYEGLLTYDWDLKPAPALAKSWEVSPDGKTITFRLQEGVTFHNGQPFTSADVQYSFMEIAKKVNPNGPVILAELTSVDTPDPMTAVFNLANPAPYLMVSLSSNNMPIVCKSVFEGTQPLNNPTANRPIGTGPFKFAEWNRGQYIRLDRNDRYWKPGLPMLNRIIALSPMPRRGRRAEAGSTAPSAVNAADIRRRKPARSLEAPRTATA